MPKNLIKTTTMDSSSIKLSNKIGIPIFFSISNKWRL
jgi:hypothetical protein